ncbi:transposase domain-containing protein [Streptomyces sp. NRRL F-2580]|uniref:transposase domain-containing protein n=1 Tax=Streptomyces sp. NRRL F-2580 TaxID=1463841 RepID=UPI00068FDFE9|nr:transposase domain-containing protein [Streptomyces sp. NRRL F-2580]
MTGWGAGQRVRIGILTKMFTAELVDAAIAKHDRAERRRRLLPARMVVYFVLALCLFARESYEEVLRLLTSGIPGTRVVARVNRSSLCRARARLGENVLETVFRQVPGPLATPDTPGAWWRGLRLLALDGTQFDLPDSTSNGDTFDGPSTTGCVPFGFPRSERWYWPRSERTESSMPTSAATATASAASPTRWPAPPAPETWSSPTAASGRSSSLTPSPWRGRICW